MRITVLSDCRVPTKADGHHGLGKSVYDLAAGLAARGHDVVLMVGEGSQVSAPLLMAIDQSENDRAFNLARMQSSDVYLDGSHDHALSKLRPEWPIVNRIGDLECGYQPPNAVVATRHMQVKYPKAKVIPTGIDVEVIPFYPEHLGYLVFMGAKIQRKGWPLVMTLGGGKEIKTGENLTGPEKWNLLGGALGLLHPSVEDAAPRLPLEAAAAGVPTLCLAVTGTPEHVEHCVSGFVCQDEAEIVGAIADLPLLDRAKCREWVAETHGFGQMMATYEKALEAAAQGVRW